MTGGARLYQALRERRFVQIGHTPLTHRHDQVLQVEPATPADTLTLVRPDGYIAWTGTDTEDLDRFLTTLVGPAATRR
ncbi:hypothetical protein [Nonomuraea rubra]|uniref:aromatic-ring hydroxylase C-terminal domain-containing protein n=1 Tax=Nonomuraea rubra TaxID=46180 RepID=UPI003605F616